MEQGADSAADKDKKNERLQRTAKAKRIPSASKKSPPKIKGEKTAGVEIPSFSKETWEYVELKIWESFRKRLWIILSSTLTIAGVIASVGLNSLIKTDIDTAIAANKEQYVAAIDAYKSQSRNQLLMAGILSILETRRENDVVKYRQKARAVRSSLSKEQIDLLSKYPKIERVLDLDWIGLISKTEPNFDDQIAQFQKDAHIIDVDSPLGHIVNVVDEIKSLKMYSSHLNALDATIGHLEAAMFDGMKADPDILANVYNKNVLPFYISQLKKNKAGMFAGEISSLSSADVELGFFIKNGLFDYTRGP